MIEDRTNRVGTKVDIRKANRLVDKVLRKQIKKQEKKLEKKLIQKSSKTVVEAANVP